MANANDAERRIAILKAALRRIVKWKFPPTGKTWDDGTPMSYGACYGSNGERDFMRAVAANALRKVIPPRPRAPKATP